MIVGNQALQESFATMIEKGTVPGVVLLVGPEGVGVSVFARDIAAGILGIPESALNRNPDFVYAGHEDEKIGVPHTVEEISDVLLRLSTKSFSGKRAVIIPDVDLFSLSVANALLKTLEESSNTTFILLAREESKILPTIRSRSTVWHVSTASDAALRVYCKQYEKKDYFDAVIGFAVGRFEVADRLFSDTKARSAWTADHDFLVQACAAPAHLRIAMGEKITPKGEHADKKLVLRERLGRFHVLAVRMMKENRDTAPAWGSWIDRLQETERALSHHGNPRLHIDNLLLALPRTV